MSKAEQKRAGLERFVSEQIIGPGSFNKRFFLLDKWNDGEFSGKSLKECHAIDNVSEITAEVPAYQYSSGILFPIAKLQGNINDTAEESADPASTELLEQDSEQIKADDEHFQDYQLESTSSRNQNYPNSCGLAFAVDSTADFLKDIDVGLAFRLYHKLSQEECKTKKLGYWIPENEKVIEAAVKSYFGAVFQTEWKDTNLFIVLKPDAIITEYLYKIDYAFLNDFAKQAFLPVLNRSMGNSIVELKSDDKKAIHGLKEGKGKQFYTVTKLNKRGKETFNDTITVHVDSIVDHIKHMVIRDSKRYDTMSELIQHLEVLGQLKDLATDFKGIYRKSSLRNRPTPIWESTLVNAKFRIPPCKSTHRIERGEIKVDTLLSLGLNYQYLKHDNGKTYVKLVLVNRNEITLKQDEPPQLNKKDVANRLAAFGVKVTVTESRPGVLVPYNPPNLIDIDEEDNLNKLIYRHFTDYGEGYNTSVNWFDKDGRKVVETEFLPQQDTPRVDFRPSRVEGGRIVDRLDEKVLSIKALSTLNDRTHAAILADLRLLIETYSEWIIERRSELSQDAIPDGRDILAKQLNACQADCDRLRRNVSLLANNESAMVAFRLMNTAMYMQLHHGIQVKTHSKSGAGAFVPSSNDENYYKGANPDYKWRSFQLAFIILNIDGFVRPEASDRTVPDVFKTAWPERNEIADLVWFPTGGGKTEAYLGIIAFSIILRRFTRGNRGIGTTVLMRYTLRLLTLQQFQRATLMICALETIRKNDFQIQARLSLGKERITIGLFVGGDSLPNRWKGNFNRPGMLEELQSIGTQLSSGRPVVTKLPQTECPWCGGALFVNEELPNVHPNPGNDDSYKMDDKLIIICNTRGCTFHDRRPTEDNSLPLRLFDEDIYKFPPTLLFGTVDKFAAIANVVSTSERNQDSRRIFGRGKNQDHLPPELIIQDELHLLLGPLGSAVGLFEKAIDHLCTFTEQGVEIKPKIVTSTATTRNTDKQIFALFGRRSEVFPKQAISCDDSFFAYFSRKSENIEQFESNRKYLGLLPVGKTQVWQQLRVTSIALVHRVHFIRQMVTYRDLFLVTNAYQEWQEIFDYYHTVLAYFNSLKEVGKTQSQLTHYLPGDVDLVSRNTMPWNIVNRILRSREEIQYSELTGRLSGKEVKTNLSKIERQWEFVSENTPPEYIISTNMISVGIDIARFNTMIVNSMPRNTAEYIQATSRVAREKEGIVFTVHHPFRSRDISHYQRFREFHEKFYGYVEPISVTPYANKALERYMAMYIAALVRHDNQFHLADNKAARNLSDDALKAIKGIVIAQLREMSLKADRLNSYLLTRNTGVRSSVDGVMGKEELDDAIRKVDNLLMKRWLDRLHVMEPPTELSFRSDNGFESLFTPTSGQAQPEHWNVKQSLREIAPSVVIKTVQQ